MRLFTVGPVEMEDEIRLMGGEPIPYFRTPEFSDLMLDMDRMLKDLMGASQDDKSVYITASGTAAMEAAVLNCFDGQDYLLIINGGTFGQRFVDICQVHDIPFLELKIPYGEVLTADMLSVFEDEQLSGMLVNLDETSTGQLYDIGLLSEFCQRKKMYLMVDAISTFLCDSYEMELYGIDVTIISSQKGLCVPPGMSVVVLSQRMIEERVLKSRIKSLYFDFKFYLKNFERGQTPYTPAIGICLQMHQALCRIEEMGLECHLGHIAEVARDFRERMVSLPVSSPSYPLSNAITPVIFDKPIAYYVFERLKDAYDIMVNPTGGATHDTVLRVAHIGKTTVEDNTFLLNKMGEAIKDVQGSQSV